MNTSTIKAFYAAHKKAIIIGVVVLAIASNSNAFQQGFNQSYSNQPAYSQQGMYRQGQQPPKQQGFFSRMFGGNENQAAASYNGGGYANAGTYTSNNNGADITSAYERQQAANDANAERFDDYILDQGKYEDGNGNTYKMSSQYNYNYVNETSGEAVQTNDASYNPGGGYTAVTPSDYSASSYTSSTTESGE